MGRLPGNPEQGGDFSPAGTFTARYRDGIELETIELLPGLHHVAQRLGPGERLLFFLGHDAIVARAGGFRQMSLRDVPHSCQRLLQGLSLQ